MYKKTFTDELKLQKSEKKFNINKLREISSEVQLESVKNIITKDYDKNIVEAYKVKYHKEGNLFFKTFTAKEYKEI